MKLVIVESPAKAKTIAKYLGNGYIVDASGGHIRDLPTKTLGVDVKNNFKPQYVLPTDGRKKDLIKRLQEKSTQADEVLLATDPDREGEAISWHLQQMLKLNDNYQRIEFHEITKSAINKAILSPRKINVDLVNAQQARRVLDRLVGYILSPVLCSKIRPKLSAGRVQSAVLKMIVDREKEVKAFVPEEYWNIVAKLSKNSDKFKSMLTEFNGKKIKVTNKQDCETVLARLKDAQYAVESVKRNVSETRPYPPFTTSALQQDAAAKLSMPSSITMQTAQELYEGLDIKGSGHTALVTYIRTDSVRVSEEAISGAREFIRDNFGDKYVPEKANFYKSKKDIQDAHEAIRPIDLSITPNSIKEKVQRNQYKLYKLIYERFLASQCVNAVYDTLTAMIVANKYGFKTTGKVLKFDGFTKIYATEKATDEDDDSTAKLPNLEVGDILTLVELLHEQKFTKPPARYNESSIIKAMEENGIGRPSTYSATLSTLYKREYVAKDNKQLVPTELGFTVTDYLEANFKDIVNVEFTAQMENKLDTIEETGKEWTAIVGEFYEPFMVGIKNAKTNTDRINLDEPSDEICDKCGAPMIIKTGRYGKYLACSAYPECKNIKSLNKTESKPTDIVCELCGSQMLEKTGRYGKFIACSNYPTCKNTKPVDDESLGKCPECEGKIVKRRSKAGKIFFACSNYPTCKYASWDVPTQQVATSNEVSKAENE